jgi:hypothetical protein
VCEKQNEKMIQLICSDGDCATNIFFIARTHFRRE